MNNLEYYGNYLKRYIEARNDMRYVRTYVRTDVRTYTVRTDKLTIEHTSVGLAHTRPNRIRNSAMKFEMVLYEGLDPDASVLY